MILQKCPRCQRDLMAENGGRVVPTVCDNCGHQVAKRPVKRRIAGVGIDPKIGQQPTRVADVRAQAQQAQHAQQQRRQAKVDTPSPGQLPRADDGRSRRPTLRIKGYDIIECRGKGGMGKVYRAVQKSLGRDVAIKTLDSNLARNQASIWRFTKEAAAMAQLRHPNILFVIDRGKERNVHYFVMEYVDGPSLREMLRDRGKFSPNEALHIMLQLARTMAYAHYQGVVHRDLKPENILYNSDKCLKVADFGLAGVNRETTYIKQLTKSYVSMGTECYMAPEQRHDAKKVDQRADIYSLGVILFELIRGELPFPALPSPDQAIVEGRRDIDAIIRCCLNYDKEHRYQTTEDFVQALEKSLEEGERVPTPVIRDTVIDTPGVNNISPLGRRIDEWSPEDFRGSSEGIDEHDSYHWQPDSRKWLRGGLALAALFGLVALFFMVAPSPKSNQKIPSHEMWQRLLPELQRIGVSQSRFHFRFAGKPDKNYLGRIPNPQWKLFGNWFALKGNLHQNTFQRGFVRNRKQQRAVFQGKEVASHGLRYRATVQILRPWYGGGITRQEYQSKHRVSRSVLVGLGWKGGTYGKTSLSLQLHGRALGFQLKIGGRKGKKCGSDQMHPGEWPRKRYTWGNPMSLEVRQNDSVVSAWIDGVKRCQVNVPRSAKLRVHPNLLCQNAHCVFKQVQIDAFSQNTAN